METYRTMPEDKAEAIAEKAALILDKKLSARQISLEEYDTEIEALNAWVAKQIRDGR